MRTSQPTTDNRTADLADRLDAVGAPDCAFDPRVRPVTESAMRGPAYTIQMHATPDIDERFYEVGLAALEPIPPGSVVVIATNFSTIASCWGGNLSKQAQGAKAVGAVTDGLVRDNDQIQSLGFAMFAAGQTPRGSRGRLAVTATQVKIRCANVTIDPGDMIVADSDGVIAVPIETWRSLAGGQ